MTTTMLVTISTTIKTSATIDTTTAVLSNHYNDRNYYQYHWDYLHHRYNDGSKNHTKKRTKCPLATKSTVKKISPPSPTS